MWIKIIINSTLITALTVLQISFIGGLPFPFSEVDLLLVFLVFLQAFSGNIKNIWMFFLAGAIIDMFFLPTASVFLLAWPATFVFSHLLFSNFFTNRSLFSLLAVCFLATWFFLAVCRSLLYLFSVFGEGAHLFFLTEGFWPALASQILLNIVAVFIVFYIFNFLSNRLRPVLMIKY